MIQSTSSFYKRNIETSQIQLQQLTRKINMLALFRLVVLIGGGILIFQVIQTENVGLTLVSFVSIILLFLLFVFFQSKTNHKRKAIECFCHVNENELAMEKSIAKNVYDNGQSFVDDSHMNTSDLDLFGENSIFQLLNRCASLNGIKRLASWLQHPASKPEIEARQQFIQELTTDFSWWQALQATLYPINGTKQDYQQFISNYLVKPIQFPGWRFFKIYITIAPYLLIVLLGLSYFKPSLVAVPLMISVIHLLLSIFFSGQITLIATGLNKGGDLLASFVPVIKQVEERKWENAKANELLNAMQRENGILVATSIQRLATLLNRLDARLNMFVGAVLNAFLLWDFKQIYALKEWQSSQSTGILEALDMLATVETVGSLATLKFNHPGWTFPKIVDHSPTLEVTGIMHPLIDKDEVVANDYSLRDHRLALITGSNMAGKSTFLRTVGVNAVLALCGGPVCATSMEISGMQVATYMRIRDSVNESTSTFKAELNRLQEILELVKTRKDTFVLLDEMLRGTNSMDKYLGSKAIIEKLIQEEGVGMVATHDLKLAELADKFPAIVKNFHFDIQVHDDEMLFDYRLKTGPCTIFNASLLLKKIGIEIE